MRKILISLLLSAGSLAAENCLTVEAAVERALMHNYDLAAQRADETEASARRWEAWSRWIPAVSLSAETRRTPQVNVGGSAANTWSMNTTISQTLLSVDAFYDVIEKRATADAACFELKAFIDQLLFDVRQAYYNTVLGEAELAVQEETVELLRQTWQRDKDRQEAGIATGFEVRESQVAVANALTDLYALRREVKVRYDTLAALLGMTCDEIDEVCVATEKIPVEDIPLLTQKLALTALDEQMSIAQAPIFNEQDLDFWMQQLCTSRPVLCQRKRELDAAQGGIGKVRGEYFPQLQAYATYIQRSDNSFGSQFFGSQTKFWETGVSLSWDLFDGLGREARVSAACARRNSAKAVYHKSVQDGIIALRTRFYELEETLYALKAAMLAAEVSDEAVELAQARRQTGAVTPLEFRDTVNSRLEAYQNLLKARFNLLIAYYALLRDVGMDRPPIL